MTSLQAMPAVDSSRYAHCIEVSRRVRWDIDEDVIRGRELDCRDYYLPHPLSRVDELTFLSTEEQKFLSQIQGRSYANIFGLVERFINCKILEVSKDHQLGDQVALEALIRFSDEEIKHQELFRRIEALAAKAMPAGYCFMPQPNDVASVVLQKSTWAVLALTCHIELFTQAHYEQCIDPTDSVSPLFKDVFLYHWKEESQHAILDELEWQREHQRLNANELDTSVDDLIALVAAVDGILQAQSQADVEYFCDAMPSSTSMDESNRATVQATVLKAYRWQYIGSGVAHPRFQTLLGFMTTDEQMTRIQSAVGPILQGL
jgi:hypothetical protein